MADNCFQSSSSQQAALRVHLTDEERKTRNRDRVKAWTAADPERARESRRKSKAKWLAVPANREYERERKRAYAAKRWKTDPEASRKASVKWRAANPEYVKNKLTEWRTNNSAHIKKYSRQRHLKKLYGLSIIEYEVMLANQNNCCAICGGTEPGGKGVWSIDHCHNYNVIRGLLCHGCNTGLGGFKDDTNVLRRAIDYLEFNSRS